MNKIFLKIALPLLFCWIIVNWLITPERYNATENRYLASLPAFSVDKLLDGSYEKEWETYAEDRIAGRDFWTSFHGSVEYALGKREINGVLVAQDSLMDRLEEPDSLTVANNIRGIQAYIQKYPQQRCFLMLIPSASAVQTQKLPAFTTLWDQWQWIESMEKQLADCLTAVNLKNSFSSHSGEYIYYRTDHHWTTLGAYYAYRELAQAMGLPVRELTEYQAEEVSHNFNGTLYSKSHFRMVSPDTITTYTAGPIQQAIYGAGPEATEQDSLFFPQYLEQKDQYAVFLGPNQPLVTIRTGVENGKKLLLFKDSYSHSLVPFFTKDYEEIVLVDLRYCNQSLTEWISIEEYDDVVFLYSVDVFSHQMQTTKLHTLA